MSNKIKTLENKRFSIIYPLLNNCCICGKKAEINEVFEGAYRQRSIKYGMCVPLCNYHHRLFHNNNSFNLEIKKEFQDKFLETHTLDDFIRLFGKDYFK